MLQNHLYIFIVFLPLFIQSQIAPQWLSTPYMEARTITAINNNQKLTGTFTSNINFFGNFPVPQITLAIPQIRVVSNSSALSFKCSDSALTQTSFLLTVTLSATTAMWTLMVRYMVFTTSTATPSLVNNFQAQQITLSPTIIDSNVGTPRNQAFNQPLTLTATTVCVDWLVGVDTTSVDNYQLNTSCAATASQITINTAVHANTLVTSLTVYVLIYDPIQLAISSLYFVDYTLTKTLYGTQQTFNNLPYGLIPNDYQAGFASFSTRNNYQLNITVNNLLVITSTTSFYDDIPQFQVRLRYCSPPTTEYNKVDGLCYAICPANTFLNSVDLTCTACIYSCLTCLTLTTCATCLSPRILDATSLCVCPTYMYEFNKTCYGCHYSCLTCSSGQYFQCLTCNPADNRDLTSNINTNGGACPCLTGYTDNGIPTCGQICGDGIAITDLCDDGNTIYGDGCSSICTIQTNWTCPKIGTTSTCYYIGNITIDVQKIDKDPYDNIATFYISVSPWIDAMCALATPSTITSNLSTIYTVISTSCIDVYGQKFLTYKVKYKDSLSLVPIRMFVKPTSTGPFSIMPAANCTYICRSHTAMRLKVYTTQQYSVAKALYYTARIFGYLILGSSILFCFGRLKWMGNSLFFSLQFQYISTAYVVYFTPILSGFGELKMVMGWNEALGIEGQIFPMRHSLYLLRYSLWYDNNVNVMVTLQGFALIMYAIYSITYSIKRKQCIKYGGDPQVNYNSTIYGKIMSFFTFQFFIFWTFFNMTNQLVAMALIPQGFQSDIVILVIINALCIIISIFPLFAKRKDIPSYTQTLYPKERGHEQSIFTLICFFIMYVLLLLSISSNKIFFYVIFVVPIIMIVYLFCRRPFQSKWIRAQYFINNFCITISLICILLLENLEDELFYLPFGTFIIILFNWIFALIIWSRQAYIICKYGNQININQLLQSGTKSIEQQEASFFRNTPFEDRTRNKPFLNSVLQQKNNKNNNLPTPRLNLNDRNKPNHVKKQYKQMEDMEKIQQMEEVKKNRQKWARQIKEMNDIKQIREKSRKLLAEQDNILKPSKSKVRTTGMKGLNASMMKQIDGQTIRFL